MIRTPVHTAELCSVLSIQERPVCTGIQSIPCRTNDTAELRSAVVHWRTIVKVGSLGLLALSLIAARPLGAEGGERSWASGFHESFEEGEALTFVAHRPAPFALELVARIGEAEFGSLGSEEAGRLALRLAVSIDEDLRFGRTIQEAGARSSQQARMLLRDAMGGGDGGADSLGKMRSRAASESARARAGSLTDPLGRRSDSSTPGWMHR